MAAMTPRDTFVHFAGWGNATAAPLAADASSRSYTRLRRGADYAILMEAPTETEADRASLTAFRRIGSHLRSLGLSAPGEYAADPANGLILMEDLGDTTLSRLLASDPVQAREAYAVTADLLKRLSLAPPPALVAPDANQMAAMAGLTFDLLPDSDALRERLLSALACALRDDAPGTPVLSLRDVHGDNLLWLPDREGHARIGLLDFQDALLLPEGYDLASLLDDPRRVVPEEWRADLIAAHSTPRRIAVLSLQRNLRILGIFHRLATQYGKPAYRAFLPRTRSLVARAAGDVGLSADVEDVLARTKAWATA